MNFFKRLFSCGASQGKDDSPTNLPFLCFQKETRTKSTNRSIALEPSSSNSKTTSLSSHMQTKSDSPAKTLEISTKIIQRVQTRCLKLQNFDIGFLIGTINGEKMNTRLCQFLSRCHKISIDKQQINLSNLRPYSLDKLVIYWNQFGCHYTIKQLLLVPQNLVIICEEFETLRSIVLRCQEELKMMSIQIYLNQVCHRLAYDIVKFQGFFAIDFKEQGYTHQQLSKTLQMVFRQDFTKQVDQLCSKITLEEYLKLCNKDQVVMSKIKQHLINIKQQPQLPIPNTEIIIQQQPIISIKVIPSQAKSQKQEPYIVTPTNPEFKHIQSDSDCEEEAKYFSPKKQQLDSPVDKQKLELQLNIFDYDNEQTEQNIKNDQYIKPKPKINLACPLQHLTKKRSRSEVMSYEQIELVYDDQIFQKYQE